MVADKAAAAQCTSTAGLISSGVQVNGVGNGHAAESRGNGHAATPAEAAAERDIHTNADCAAVPMDVDVGNHGLSPETLSEKATVVSEQSGPVSQNTLFLCALATGWFAS